MNLAQIRALVSSRLDDADATYTAAEINAAINEGQQLFAWLTLCLQKTATFNVTAAAGAYHLLSTFPDYFVPLRVAVAGAKVRPARFSDLDALNQHWRDATGTAPVRYVAKGSDVIVLYPLANATVSLTYGRSAAVLAGDLDVPEIPELYHLALADYATYRPLAPQGGSMLVKATAYLKSYTDVRLSAQHLVRGRFRALEYDTLPLELAQQKGKAK